MINIVDAEGSAIIKLDDIDSKKDIFVKDGKEILLSDAVEQVEKTEE